MNGGTEEKPDPCEILIDAEGEWFHRGNRLTRPEILEELYLRLEVTPSGDYLLRDGQANCLLEVADTPFVVSRVDKSGAGSNEEVIELTLKHQRERQILDPATLFIGEANVLYCQLSGGRLRARFSRPAYYQLAEYVREGPQGSFFLELNGRKHPIGCRESMQSAKG